MSDDRRYSDEDVRAVVARALDRKPGQEITHADLLDIGKQIGLSSDDIERAAVEVREARLVRAAEDRSTARRRFGLAAHTVVYAVLNGLMFLVNFLSTPGQWWILFPVFIWGLALLLHAGIVLGLKRSIAEPARVRVGGAPGRQRLESGAGQSEESADRADEEQGKRAKR